MKIPIILEGTHPRFEGPRYHLRMITNIRLNLLTWLVNCDSKVIIDDNFAALHNYIYTYAFIKEFF